MKLTTIQKFRNQMLTLDNLCMTLGLERHWDEDENEDPTLFITLPNGEVRVEYCGEEACVNARSNDCSFECREAVTDLHQIAYQIGLSVSWLSHRAEAAVRKQEALGRVLRQDPEVPAFLPRQALAADGPSRQGELI